MIKKNQAEQERTRTRVLCGEEEQFDDVTMNNEISYGFKNTEAPKISVMLRLLPDEAELCFEDNGLPFDPLSDAPAAPSCCR